MREFLEGRIFVIELNYKDWLEGRYQSFSIVPPNNENDYLISPSNWNFREYPDVNPTIADQLSKLLPATQSIVRLEERISRQDFQQIKDKKKELFDKKVKVQSDWFCQKLKENLVGAEKPILLITDQIQAIEKLLDGQGSLIISTPYKPIIKVIGKTKQGEDCISEYYKKYVVENHHNRYDIVSSDWQKEEGYLDNLMVNAFALSRFVDWAKKRLNQESKEMELQYKWIIDIIETCSLKEVYQNQLSKSNISIQTNVLIKAFNRIQDVLELMGKEEALKECSTYLSNNKRGYKDLTSIPEGNRDNSFLPTKFILETAIRFYTKYISILSEEFEIEASKKESPKKVRKKPLYSLLWHGQDSLENFWNKTKLFFHPSTAFEQFEKIFSAIEINESFPPIRWYNSNASELLFFIKTMQIEELIDNPNRQDYKQLKSCFIDNNGNPFSQDLKSIFSKLDINLGATKQEKITKIISKFK